MRNLIAMLAGLALADVPAAELSSPTGTGALAPALARTPAGTLVLSWLEPAGDEEWTLKCSRLDSGSLRWHAPVTIASGRDWFINWADFPNITALSETDYIAVWFVNNPTQGGGHAGHHGPGYHAVHSVSYDGGTTWRAPQPVTGESASVEFTTVLALGENSRGLAAWLDGRARAAGRDEQALYAQTFLASGPDQLVDGRVCDCCQLSLVRVRDGALLAYRDRSADEIRDISLARWRDGRWESPQPLHDDGWKIAACPVNGPRLVVHGDSVAAAWYSAAQNQPRVQVKLSRDAGASWSPPVRVDLGRPQGRVDCLLRDDGTVLVSWLELSGAEGTREGGIYLRAVGPDGALGEPQLLAATRTTRASGFPRLAALPDGRVLLAYTIDDEPSRIATLLLAPK